MEDNAVNTRSVTYPNLSPTSKPFANPGHNCGFGTNINADTLQPPLTPTPLRFTQVDSGSAKTMPVQEQ